MLPRNHLIHLRFFWGIMDNCYKFTNLKIFAIVFQPLLYLWVRWLKQSIKWRLSPPKTNKNQTTDFSGPVMQIHAIILKQIHNFIWVMVPRYAQNRFFQEHELLHNHVSNIHLLQIKRAVKT